MQYRKLTAKEISLLENNGCFSNNWKKIDVHGSFNCTRIQQVNFSGTIKIGRFDKDIHLPGPGGVKKPAGLYNCNIHNCIIEDNVLISNVNSIANYKIESDVVIENCREIIVHGNGKTSFGNGTEIEVLNEGGGRELKIFDKLTAQIAYLIVMYRHKSAMIKKMQKMIDLYIKARRSGFGQIKKGCKIINNIKLVNVEVGPFTTISGVLHLEEGTICSSKEDPVVIGAGVIARHFIIHSGTKVDGSAMLDKCFVGQGVRLGKQFSAENSVFFANSEGFHGEACSIFAGPYTVTHHKSTLLIAGMFSFFNAGSGTNQSNHMYKLGPVHQGILERGCKTGSFSYLLWPSHVGAYTAVIGKHYSNFDTSNLPFSYITEDNGKSIITPAMNLFTVGTKRDAEKWPARDRRKTSDKLDLINFTLFTPYIFRKMHTAAKVLKKLYEDTPKEQEFVNYNGIMIKRLMLKTCAKYYNIGLKIAIGKSLLSRIGEISDYKNFNELKSQLVCKSSDAESRWVDISGMICTGASIDKLLKDIEEAKIKNIDDLLKKMKNIHKCYAEEEWKYYCGVIEQESGVKIKDITPEHLEKIIRDWKESVIKLNNMILKDAEKEFDSNARIGYGIDGDKEIRSQDFKAVRGTIGQNKFIKGLMNDSKKTEEIGKKILNFLNGAIK